MAVFRIFFFFQAEDGIRDYKVTGVQTCALPILRSYACGKPRCRCHDDPPVLHGPYAEWTRKIDGKTVTRRLSPEQLAAWQPLFDNARKMRDLIAQIQDHTLQAVDAGDP